MTNHSDKPTMKVVPKNNQGKNSDIERGKVTLVEQYSTESVVDYSFSNFVRVTANQSGMLLSFGKIHPQAGKIIVFDEILLPFEVALSLSKIIQNQFENLKKDGLIELIPAKRAGSETE